MAVVKYLEFDKENELKKAAKESEMGGVHGGEKERKENTARHSHPWPRPLIALTSQINELPKLCRRRSPGRAANYLALTLIFSALRQNAHERF